MPLLLYFISWWLFPWEAMRGREEMNKREGKRSPGWDKASKQSPIRWLEPGPLQPRSGPKFSSQNAAGGRPLPGHEALDPVDFGFLDCFIKLL